MHVKIKNTARDCFYLDLHVICGSRSAYKLSKKEQGNSIYQLMALRIWSAFRATSDTAVLAVAGKIPVEILEKEMNVLRLVDRHTLCKDAAKSKSYDIWQRRWDESTKCR